MKVDVTLANSVFGAAERAQALERTGVDGVFTFENAHDVFFPLVAAAPVCSLDLMTNVAMAFPRSPLHLAHAAYDLQQLSRGPFPPGARHRRSAPHREALRRALGQAGRARCASGCRRSRRSCGRWQDGTPLDFHGEYTTHTLMTPAFNPGPNPYGIPKILVGALGPRMNEMAAEVADGILVMPFNTERHMRGADDAGDRTGARLCAVDPGATSRSSSRSSSAWTHRRGARAARAA